MHSNLIHSVKTVSIFFVAMLNLIFETDKNKRKEKINILKNLKIIK